MTTPAPASHAPDDYVCPFCGLVAGDVSDPGNRCELGDTVYQDEDLLVLIAVIVAVSVTRRKLDDFSEGKLPGQRPRR